MVGCARREVEEGESGLKQVPAPNTGQTTIKLHLLVKRRGEKGREGNNPFAKVQGECSQRGEGITLRMCKQKRTRQPGETECPGILRFMAPLHQRKRA